jgi:hypothetical protein
VSELASEPMGTGALPAERSEAVSDELLFLFCPSCGREGLAETPPCSDGHSSASGDACPDKACVECGTALLLDAPLFELAAGPGSRSRRAA